MADIDSSLSESLNKLSQNNDLAIEGEVAEVARVKKARAKLTEQARNRGDDAGNLLNNLLGEASAQAQARLEEKVREKKEAAEREKAKKEAELEKKRLEAEEKLRLEKQRLEEKEQRRKQMLADLEKKRKLEAGEVDEEEEERKRLEAEEAARIQAEKEAAERAEWELTQEKIRANQERINALAPKPVDPKIAAAKKRQKLIIRIAAAAVVVLAIGGGITYYELTKKAPDFFVLQEDYPTATIALTAIPPVEIAEMSLSTVKQSADPVAGSGKSRAPKITDRWGIGSTATDVLDKGGSGEIVK